MAPENRPPLPHPRIKLTEKMLTDFFENIFSGRVSELCSETGLPYGLVYNLAHGRIRSLSARDYGIIFGEEPPHQEPERVQGEFFRAMVKLWLFLNDDVTEADLYKEFYPGKKFHKIDYRIFGEHIKTVKTRLERMMRKKLLHQGLDEADIEEWVEELKKVDDQERIPYEDIRPVLDYLEKTLEVNPSRILHQWVDRYESGELNTISKKVYDYALELKKKAEEAMGRNSTSEREKLREEVYGQRKGFTLFSKIKEELEFLCRQTGKSPKVYLGRSISSYQRLKLKRIASWRAQKIETDCHELIENRPDLRLRSLPTPYLRMKAARLLAVLRSYLKKKIIQDRNGAYESIILTPSYHSREEYETDTHGYVSIDKAASALGMSQRAFDLLVAENCSLFKKMGRHIERWYLPDSFLKELKEKEGFILVKSKYEFLAKGNKSQIGSVECLSDRR